MTALRSLYVGQREIGWAYHKIGRPDRAVVAYREARRLLGFLEQRGAIDEELRPDRGALDGYLDKHGPSAGPGGPPLSGPSRPESPGLARKPEGAEG